MYIHVQWCTMMYNGVYIILYIDSILMHAIYAIQQYDVIHIDMKELEILGLSLGSWLSDSCFPGSWRAPTESQVPVGLDRTRSASDSKRVHGVPLQGKTIAFKWWKHRTHYDTLWHIMTHYDTFRYLGCQRAIFPWRSEDPPSTAMDQVLCPVLRPEGVHVGDPLLTIVVITIKGRRVNLYYTNFDVFFPLPSLLTMWERVSNVLAGDLDFFTRTWQYF